MNQVKPAGTEASVEAVATATPPIDSGRPPKRFAYLSVRSKFALAMILSLAWLILTTRIALPWMHELANLTNWPIAFVVVGGIALVPGVMNIFLAASLLLDHRPPRASIDIYPGITILIAAYNEEGSILDTLRSIERQNYPGPIGSAHRRRLNRRHRTAGRDSELSLVAIAATDDQYGQVCGLNRGLAEARI